MARYDQVGLDGLAERSHRPHHLTNQIAARPRRGSSSSPAAPALGSVAHPHQLGRTRFDPLPSHMAIYRALVRHG